MLAHPKSLSLLTALVLPVLVLFGGCTDKQMIKQAQGHEKAAEVYDDSAAVVEKVGEFIPDGLDEHQAVAFARNLIPESWRDRFDQAIAIGRTIDEAAASVALEIRQAADGERSTGATLRAKAAEEGENRFYNFITSIEGALTSGGLAAALLKSVLGGFQLKRERQAHASTTQLANDGWSKAEQAEQELGRVVFSFDNAMKADATLKERVQANGAQIRSDQGAELSKKIGTLRIIKT